jgi:hypothetical protein
MRRADSGCAKGNVPKIERYVTPRLNCVTDWLACD